MLIFKIIRTVKTKTVPKAIKNFCREIFVFDKKIGKNNSAYPINIPIHAVKNHENPFVYTAQVNRRRQIEE